MARRYPLATSRDLEASITVGVVGDELIEDGAKVFAETAVLLSRPCFHGQRAVRWSAAAILDCWSTLFGCLFRTGFSRPLPPRTRSPPLQTIDVGIGVGGQSRPLLQLRAQGFVVPPRAGRAQPRASWLSRPMSWARVTGSSTRDNGLIFALRLIAFECIRMPLPRSRITKGLFRTAFCTKEKGGETLRPFENPQSDCVHFLFHKHIEEPVQNSGEQRRGWAG